MQAQGNVGLTGKFSAVKISRADLQRQANARVRRWHTWNWLTVRWREAFFRVFLLFLPLIRFFIPALCVLRSDLRLKVLRADGTVEDYGCVGHHLVVTAGKNAVAGAFNNVAPEPELFKFHGYGTGTNAAAAGDTALQTELTTQYVSNVRPTGSQANSTNTYTTVGTLSPDSGGTIAVTEWGLFSADAAGTLLDRQVFSAINIVASADSLQTTYVLTVS